MRTVFETQCIQSYGIPDIHHDSAIVHPDYRGNGLQRKLLEVALTLLRPGIVGIGATVSPENQYSLNNALASGFEIVCRREMYGGYDRYLLAKAPLRHLR